MTGNAAKLAVAQAMDSLTSASQEVLRRILIKDLRCGTGVTLINQIWPGLIPVFDVQLSEVYDPKRVTAWPVGFQRKLDGVRCIAVIDPDNVEAQVRMVTREGHPMPAMAKVAEIIQGWMGLFAGWRHKPIYLDGEATSGTFNDTVSQVRRKSKEAEDAVFNVFDVYGPGGSDMTQEQRLKLVTSLVNTFDSPRIGQVPVQLCHSDDEVQAAVQREWDAGEEGGMVKILDAPYELKRGYHWMKVKAYDSAEFMVIGLFPGTGKNEGKPGGFVVRLDNGGTCNVSGITDALRDELAANPDTATDRWIEVGFHERTPDGSLRHPRFVKFRDSLTGRKE